MTIIWGKEKFCSDYNNKQTNLQTTAKLRRNMKRRKEGGGKKIERKPEFVVAVAKIVY